MKLEPAQLLTVLNLASKACEFEPALRLGLITEGLVFEADQFRGAVGQVIPILAKFDRENPGVLALPHDGLGWGVRYKEVDHE